jgi:hypothetical protein
MIPEAAVLVVGDDDGGVLPVRAVAHRVDQLLGVALAVEHVGVARVLVHLAEWLDERDRRKRSGPGSKAARAPSVTQGGIDAG